MNDNKKSAAHPAIKDIMFSGEDICLIFKDSSRLVVPLEKFPALQAAELQDRCDCNPADKGTAVVWGKLGLTITLDEFLAV